MDLFNDILRVKQEHIEQLTDELKKQDIVIRNELEVTDNLKRAV